MSFSHQGMLPKEIDAMVELNIDSFRLRQLSKRYFGNGQAIPDGGLSHWARMPAETYSAFITWAGDQP